MYRPLFIVILLLLTACDQNVSFTLPTNLPVDVVAAGNFEQIQPSDNRHKQLHHWLENNKNGWSTIYATTPSGGVLVRAGDLRLQFFGTTAYVSTSDGILSKEVKQSEYAFLILPTDTNQRGQYAHYIRRTGRAASRPHGRYTEKKI